MMKLYDYQEECITSLFEYLKITRGKPDSNPLLQIPTGGGKSLIQAYAIKKIIKIKKDASIICLCHMTEVIKQNFSEFINYVENANVGIYCGKLNRKDSSNILFSSIQSVYKSELVNRWFDFVFIDEAHLCNNKSQGIYRTFVEKLRKINPKLRIVGLTATPWRMDGGCLISGAEKLFTCNAYTISLKTLINNKHLVPIVTPKDTKLFSPNLEDLVMSPATKDFTLDSQESAMMKAVEPSLEEALRIIPDRRKVIVFCPTIKICEKALAFLEAQGETAALFLGTTKENDRTRLKQNFENHRLRFLVSVNALTTGFNSKPVDAIICLRATASSSLWIQILGRGMRTYPRKDNCMLLDYGDNINRHGPVELIESPPAKQAARDNKLAGEYVFIKRCPSCNQEIPLQAKICQLCNYEYPVIERKFHPLIAGKDALFVGSNESEKMFIMEVGNAWLSHYVKEETNTQSIKMSFMCKNGKSFDKFFKFDSSFGGKLKAQSIEFINRVLFNDGEIVQDLSFDDRVKLFGELSRSIEAQDYAGFMDIMRRAIKYPTDEEFIQWHKNNPYKGQMNGDQGAIDELAKKLTDYIIPEKIKVDFEGKYPQVTELMFYQTPNAEAA